MNRLIIPVYEGGELVAFQAADMTGRAQVKYKNSDNDMDYLYGLDGIQGGLMILTEGLMDQWRVRECAVCTFGASLTEKQQTRIIDSKIQQLVFLWDNDAYWKARDAADYFRPFIPEVYVVLLPDGDDPDSYGHDGCWELIREEIE
jgi:DNA primase